MYIGVEKEEGGGDKWRREREKEQGEGRKERRNRGV